jgi:heterodisulfide reductase subunit A-like polyferredoxin
VATRVLIAGGGVAAIEAALALRSLAEGRVSVELLAPEPLFGIDRSLLPKRSISAKCGA